MTEDHEGPARGHERRHRGAHPEDRRLFAAAQLPALRAATADLSWLLDRGYAAPSALKLVGDRYRLNERQRLGVSRAACAASRRERRLRHRLPVESVHGRALIVDGFNLIITTEAALGGGVILICRDECFRDLASVHGSYRAVAETAAALDLIGDLLMGLAPVSVEWLLDSPVSNSGRLAQQINTLATERGWPWQARVVFSPDTAIMRAEDRIAVTSDSNILDSVMQWVDLSAILFRERLSDAWLVDLREPGSPQRTGDI